MERGKVGRILSQLVLDIRHIMEPHTASKLKVGGGTDTNVQSMVGGGTNGYIIIT